MSGWGGLGGYLEDLNERRNRAADPADNAPDNNAFRRACDWAARKGGVVAGAPHVQFGCGPYWDDQPDYVPPEPSVTAPPYEGGQCAVPYFIDFEWEECNTPRGNTIGPVPGPLGGLTITETLADDGPCNGERMKRWRASIGTGTGGQANQVFTNVDGDISVSVRRSDGLPDDCGDPPPVTTNPDPRDVPPTRLPPDGTPVPIGDPNDPNDPTPPIVFPPTDTPYDPWIPIVNPPPGFPPFVFPPSGGDDIPPREGPETDVPPGGTDGDDIPEPEPVLPSEVCIGYAFDFYDIPENRGGIPGAVPARYYEIFGSAQLKIGTDSGEFYDLPVKIDSRRGVCYRSDESLKVIGLSLNSKVSFGPVRVKPIFVLKENKS